MITLLCIYLFVAIVLYSFSVLAWAHEDHISGKEMLKREYTQAMACLLWGPLFCLFIWSHTR